MTAPSLFLSTAQVAEVLGCSSQHVRRTIHRGHLRALVDGALIRISRADLDAYIAAHTTGPASKGRLRSTA